MILKIVRQKLKHAYRSQLYLTIKQNLLQIRFFHGTSWLHFLHFVAAEFAITDNHHSDMYQHFTICKERKISSLSMITQSHVWLHVHVCIWLILISASHTVITRQGLHFLHFVAAEFAITYLYQYFTICKEENWKFSSLSVPWPIVFDC